MADSPLPMGTIVHRLIYQMTDGPDEGSTPDIVPMQGEGTLTCSVQDMPYRDAEGPLTMFMGPLPVVIDDQGYLCHRDGDKLVRGIDVNATQDWPTGPGLPELLVTGATWTMEYRFEPIDGTTIRLRPFSFSVPAGQTVDLAYVMKVPASQPLGVPQAEAAANRAADSAAAAAVDAASAEAIAQSVRDDADAGAFKGDKGDPGNATMRVDTSVGTRIYLSDGGG